MKRFKATSAASAAQESQKARTITDAADGLNQAVADNKHLIPKLHTNLGSTHAISLLLHVTQE